MRIGTETVGPVGGSLLGLAAAVALGLGAAGISNHTGLPTSATSSLSQSRPKKAQAGSAGSKPAVFRPTKIGLPINSSPYAQLAQRIYPGPMSGTAQTMLSGMRFSVKKQGSSLVVRLQEAASSKPLLYRSYPLGYSFFIVDPNASDDMPPLGEYDPADDVFLAVNPQGHIVS